MAAISWRPINVTLTDRARFQIADHEALLRSRTDCLMVRHALARDCRAYAGARNPRAVMSNKLACRGRPRGAVNGHHYFAG